MPCRDDGYHDSDDEAKILKKKLDKVTRLLCGVLGDLESSWGDCYRSIIGKNVSRNKDLMKFWTDHKAADAKRRKEEEIEQQRIALTKSALSKLTDDEKRALGLHPKSS